jgi:hypothetical protein
MAGSTTNVPMYPGYTTLLPYYLTSTYAIYTNIYAASSYCTEVSVYPKLHQQNEYYTGDLKYYTTKATKYCTTSYAVLGYYTDVSKYYFDYRHYTEAAAYYNTKAVECEWNLSIIFLIFYLKSGSLQFQSFFLGALPLLSQRKNWDFDLSRGLSTTP